MSVDVVRGQPLVTHWEHGFSGSRDRLRWSGGMELCNKFDAVFIKSGVFEDVFINENLFNKKFIIIRRNSNENE